MDFINNNILWISGLLIFFLFFGIGFFADKRQQKIKKATEEKLLNNEKYDMTIDIEQELLKENGMLKHAPTPDTNIVKEEQIANIELQQPEKDNVLLNAISKANNILSETKVSDFQFAPINTPQSEVNILSETINSMSNMNTNINNQTNFVNHAINFENKKKQEEIIMNINEIKAAANVLENDLNEAKQTFSTQHIENLDFTCEMENLDKEIEEILSITQDFTNLFQNNSQIQTAKVNFNEQNINTFSKKQTNKVEQID